MAHPHRRCSAGTRHSFRRFCDRGATAACMNGLLVNAWPFQQCNGCSWWLGKPQACGLAVTSAGQVSWPSARGLEPVGRAFNVWPAETLQTRVKRADLTALQLLAADVASHAASLPARTALVLPTSVCKLRLFQLHVQVDVCRHAGLNGSVQILHIN